ncbi:MAG: CpaD family pilus assembly protein [Novosphingobium sp.]
MRKITFRNALAGAFTASLALSLGACGGMPSNRSLESVHQPVVQRTNYTLDLTSGPGGLAAGEQSRLAGWFEAMDLKYGDRISIDDPLASRATRASVEAVASRFGMLVGETAPQTPGYVNAGTVRVVVSRSFASVQGCPDWGTKSDTNMHNATSSGYGCAINGNIAAMVANPEDLVKGSSGTGVTTVMSSTKAIDSYRTQAPTGEKGLKATSTQTGGN